MAERRITAEAAVAAIAEPAALVTADTRIVAANEAFREVLAHRVESAHVVDAPLRDVVAADVASQIEPVLELVWKRTAGRVALDAPIGPGRPRRAEVVMTTLPEPSGAPDLALLVLRPIEQSHSQSERESAIAVIRQAVWQMKRADELPPVLTVIRGALLELGVTFDLCAVNVVDPVAAGPSVQVNALASDGQPLQYTPPFRSARRIMRPWRAGETAYRPDLPAVLSEDEPGREERAQAALAKPVRSVIDIPFSHGTLAVNSATANAFDPEDISFLETVARTLSHGMARVSDFQALDRARDALVEKTQLLDSVGQVAAVILGSLDIEAILDTLVVELARSALLPNALIAVVDDDTDELVIARSVGHDLTASSFAQHASAVGRRYPADAPNVMASAVRDGELVVARGEQREFDLQLLPGDLDATDTNVYAIPIKKPDRVLAVLVTCAPRADHGATVRRVGGMGGLLKQAAIALERAQLHRRALDAHDELRRVISSAQCVLWHSHVERRAEGHRWRSDLVGTDVAGLAEFTNVDIDPAEEWDDALRRARLPASDARAAQTTANAFERSEDHYSSEICYIDRDGEVRCLHEDVFIEPRGANRWYCVGVWTDITERKATEDEILRLNASLESEVLARTRDLEAELRERRRVEETLRRTQSERAQLMHRVLTVQEEERTHIAGELHDRAGQSMTSVLVRLKSMAQEAPGSEGRALADELRTLVTDCMTDIRDIAVAVRPATLDRLGLVSALEQELQTLAGHFDLQVDFVAEDASADGLAPDAEIAIFRVVQAALTNVARHAQARAVSVVMQRRDAIVSTIIEDDGVGFDVDAVLAGPVESRFGLMAMEERLRPFDGTIRFESAAGAGATVFIEIEASGRST